MLRLSPTADASRYSNAKCLLHVALWQKHTVQRTTQKANAFWVGGDGERKSASSLSSTQISGAVDDDGARRDRDGARPARPGGNTAGSGQRGEADRLGEAGPWPARLGGLEIAEKLLAARDLVGCKRFAERAVEADPLLPGADELLAVADVLLASQSMGPLGHPDPLAILQLPPGANPDHAAVSRAFRRLALLLGQRNPHPGAEMALRLVNDAYAVLSDPSRRAPPSANPATGTPSFSQYVAAGAAAAVPPRPTARPAPRPRVWRRFGIVLGGFVTAASRASGMRPDAA